jgi:hypothetical protein
MKKSNIFAYIELSKLVDELRLPGATEKLKEKLKAQSAYFSIIEPRYFSDSLVHEWEGIVSLLKQKGARVDENGKVVSSAVRNTIDSLTSTECERLVDRVFQLHEKVKKEFA